METNEEERQRKCRASEVNVNTLDANVINIIENIRQDMDRLSKQSHEDGDER